MIKMKKIFKTSSFKDFTGAEHAFTVCAALFTHDEESKLILCVPVGTIIDDKPRTFGIPVDNYEKDGTIAETLFIGVSICNPSDSYSQNLGEAIAFGKAMSGKKPRKWFASCIKGMFTDAIINAVIDEEIANVQRYPENYIKGYIKAKLKFEKAKILRDEFLHLNENERKLVMTLSAGDDTIKALTRIAREMSNENLNPLSLTAESKDDDDESVVKPSVDV